MALILVNFGGPRDLKEIASFLEELLCDRDVVRSGFPHFFHQWLFRRIAKKRAVKIIPDYELIGGRSPIYFDTEAIGKSLGQKVITFHRYLKETHAQTLLEIESLEEESATVLPLFPQFTYATTGSIARFFQNHLSKNAVSKLRWIPSYCDHPAFIQCWQKLIQEFLEKNQIESPILLFSAHGMPESFVKKGDPYQNQCERSFQAIMKAFPDALGRLAYQSKFGRGEWLKPYTNICCEEILQWNEGRKSVVFIPISFTSDHIETLYEIESLYLPIIQEKGLIAYRCPALNLEPIWVEALKEILRQTPTLKTSQLVRRQIFKNHVGSILP